MLSYQQLKSQQQFCTLTGEGTVSDPIVIDLTSDDEEDEQSIILSSAHSPSPAPTTTHTSASSSSSMPHIVTSGSIYRPHSQLCTDSSSRSVVVKRRCSSTDGGLDANELPITSVSTNARPVPVITEYAPSLPLFRPVVPFLVQPTVQTVLASSDYPRHTGLNGAHNLDDLHLPSLNCEFGHFSSFNLSAKMSKGECQCSEHEI